MKRIILLLALVSIISCNKENNTSLGIEKPYLVDISNDTDATAALIFDDGSYAIYDSDTCFGFETIYISNLSNGKDPSKGMTVFLDEKHLPKYASYNGDCYFFSNYEYDTFDLAVVDQSGNIEYYWDIETGVSVDKYLSGIESRTKASDTYYIAMGVTAKIVSYGMLGAILGAAIVSGGTVAIVAASAGVVLTGVAEAIQSGYIDVGEDYYHAVNGLSILYSTLTGNAADVIQSMCAMGEGMVGDGFFGLVGQYEEPVANCFDCEEWQIKLSTNYLYCSPESKQYRVPVNSKARWNYEIPSGQKSFCSVSKDGNDLIITPENYEGTSDRDMKVVIKTVDNKEEIQPATLTIVQTGYLFELSEDKITFSEEGGSKTISVRLNNQITDWEISYPKVFCKVKVDKKKASFTVTVDKYEIENQYGTITVTGYVKNSSLFVERKVNVEQIIHTWDGTTWSMTYDFVNLQYSANEHLEWVSESPTVSSVLSIKRADKGEYVDNPGISMGKMTKTSEKVLSFKDSFSHTETVDLGDGEKVSSTFKRDISVTITRVDENNVQVKGRVSASVTGYASGSASADITGRGSLVSNTKTINENKTAGKSVEGPLMKVIIR